MADLLIVKNPIENSPKFLNFLQGGHELHERRVSQIFGMENRNRLFLSQHHEQQGEFPSFGLKQSVHNTMHFGNITV